MLALDVQHRLGAFVLDARFAAPGPVTALWGPSGAGKTTIVNLIAGLIRPDHGRIAVDALVLTDTTRRIFVPPRKRRVGYVFQDGRLFPHLTVRQNLLYGHFLTPRQERAAELTEIVALLGLQPLLGRRPRGLSGGEQQRVALGRALLMSPRLLLMDEPLASLDAARREEILPYLEQLRTRTRVPIVYVSHNRVEVERLASSIVCIEAGRVTRLESVARAPDRATWAAMEGGRT